ncbi:hypothetical protein QN372_19740 [Undibacterium sp. RTI2.1]|uniref:hypothetical protein n=1 Tax=unclassified Undibacterium TaxID=2630295 RepID=UPI002B239FCB|nr:MULTISPECIES: hypothetical protein [unclassified Undibacterium]MEB0032985.1 hypothetical protein [Undibacterium sp. RTI2.1]MEB0118842.1 hypothetical protein [Undibacterium sp. RTI2.2]
MSKIPVQFGVLEEEYPFLFEHLTTVKNKQLRMRMVKQAAEKYFEFVATGKFLHINEDTSLSFPSTTTLSDEVGGKGKNQEAPHHDEAKSNKTTPEELSKNSASNVTATIGLDDEFLERWG